MDLVAVVLCLVVLPLYALYGEGMCVEGDTKFPKRAQHFANLSCFLYPITVPYSFVIKP